MKSVQLTAKGLQEVSTLLVMHSEFTQAFDGNLLGAGPVGPVGPAHIQSSSISGMLSLGMSGRVSNHNLMPLLQRNK